MMKIKNLTYYSENLNKYRFLSFLPYMDRHPRKTSEKKKKNELKDIK